MNVIHHCLPWTHDHAEGMEIRPEEGNSVAVTSFNIAVETVVADVGSSTLKPRGGYLSSNPTEVRLADGLGIERCFPVELGCNLAPELILKRIQEGRVKENVIEWK